MKNQDGRAKTAVLSGLVMAMLFLGWCPSSNAQTEKKDLSLNTIGASMMYFSLNGENPHVEKQGWGWGLNGKHIFESGYIGVGATLLTWKRKDNPNYPGNASDTITGLILDGMIFPFPGTGEEIGSRLHLLLGIGSLEEKFKDSSSGFSASASATVYEWGFGWIIPLDKATVTLDLRQVNFVEKSGSASDGYKTSESSNKGYIVAGLSVGFRF